MSVRWDAVVKNNRYWSSRHAPGATATAPDAKAIAPEPAAAGVEVQVWLFGRLARPEVANPLQLAFAGGCAVRDVIDELGRRLGPDFLGNLVNESGASLNTCRVFVDGEAATDMATPIRRATATVEIILFREIEGG